MFKTSVVSILMMIAFGSTQFVNADPEDVLDKMQEHAEELAESGDSAGALKEYVATYNKSHDFPAWSGVRNSFLLGNMMQLAQKYPPTLDALRDLRNRAEEKILAGKAATDVFQDWISLNGSLQDGGRSLVVYDRLHQRKMAVPDEVTQMVLPELVSQKRYAEGHNAAISEAKYELTRLPELIGYRGSANGLQRILSSRYPVYECLVGTNEFVLARQLQEQLVKVSNTKATYDGLIAAAMRAGNSTVAAQLRSASATAK